MRPTGEGLPRVATCHTSFGNPVSVAHYPLALQHKHYLFRFSQQKVSAGGGGYRCHLRRDAVTPSGGGQKAKEAACSKAGIGKGCVMEATLDSTMGPTDNFGCATLNPSLLLVRICYIWFPWEEHTLLVYIFLVFVGCCRWGLVFCGPRDKRCLAQYLT